MAQLELKIGDKTYNKAWVDNLSSTSQISSDPASVNYGVIPSTGNATMRDINGQIRADIENNVLPISNAPTKISINGNQVQEHTTSDSDYNIIDKSLSLQFSDRLSLLDKVTYGGMPLREYQMTAYDMLDDVIGSYGGYCREKVVNWTKYQHGDVITTTAYNNRISVKTGSGYEIIGAPIKVVPNVQHTVRFAIKNINEYTALNPPKGIAVQVLNSVPTDTDCSTISLATAHLEQIANVTTLGNMQFTTSKDTVYFVINFGWAADDQDVAVEIASVTIDGKALSRSTQNECFSRAYVDSVSPYFGVQTETAQEILSNINISYPYLPQATYRETIEKFCNLGQLTVALDEDGAIQFYGARPCYANETIRNIPNSYKISNLDKTLFLKNKFDGVDIKQDKTVDNIDYNTLYYNKSVQDVSDYSANSRNETKESATSQIAVSFRTYYTTFDVSIPKKTDDGLKDILRVLTGTDNKGNPFVKWDVTWEYQYFNKEADRAEDIWDSNIETGDIVTAQFLNANTPTEPFCDPMGITIIDMSQNKASATCDDKSNTTTTPNLFKLQKIDNEKEYWVATVNLLVGKEARFNLNGTNTTSSYQGGRFIPKSANVAFYGDVREISFTEVDASSANIENATTTVSVPTNELMQNYGNVTAIRDNILSDYANGVPTATIDVFCGLGDWKNGEVIKPNEIVTFDDDIDDNGDKNYWRVTGRTFKYQGAPTLSLELQQQKKWHTLWKWTGSVKKDDIWDESGSGNNETGMIDLPVTVDDPSNTLIAAKITFVENGVEKTHNIAGVRVARTSIVVGEIAEVECWINIRSNGTEVDYFAGYQQIQQGGETLTGYVKSIEITQLTTAEFY